MTVAQKIGVAVKNFFKEYWIVILITAIFKLALFVFAYVKFPSFSQMIGSWIHWDGYRYLDIAENWYESEAGRNIVWFPTYPLIIRALSALFGDLNGSAVMISTFFSFSASIFLFKLVLFDFNKKTALLSVWFMNIFPTAYFLQAPYTESLYLTLSLAAIYWFRKGMFSKPAIVGAMASLTRLNGILIAPLIFTETLLNRVREKKRWLKILAVLIVISSGFAVYLAINFSGFGDPFYFLEIQRIHQSRYLEWPWIGINGLIGTLPHAEESYAFAEFGAILLAFIGTFYAFFKIRKSYGVYMLLNFLLITSTGFILSTPRYVLILFPIFIMLGKTKNQFIINILSFASITLLFYYTNLFIEYKWAF